MYHIVNEIILYVLGSFVLASIGIGTKAIIAILISITICCLNMAFANKYLAQVFCVMQLIISVFVPELAILSAIWVYALAYFEAYIVLGIGAFVVCPMLFHFDVQDILFVYCCMIIAMYLANITRKSERNSRDVKRIRDDSEEISILLKDKNRRLIEKQDQEVYVATLKERNRIAREIHDNVGHILTRTILQMGALMTINKEEPLHGQLTSVKENLDIAMNNVRESVHDLHDESVDMKQAVEEMMNELREHFETTLEYDISKQLDKEIKYALIGIVREAISNIMKHSSNDFVQIIMREHPGMYQLVIHDYSKSKKDSPNANQFFGGISKSGGIGLQNIEDRVHSMKGNLTIDVSNGFRIFVTIPK